MMILRSAPASPFGRKIKIAASLAGISTLSIVDADTMSETDSIRRENPLGKIPTLILADGTSLYDSRVILEYLDHLAGAGTLIPTEPTARFKSLTLQALCDGVMDAALLIVYETRWREAAHHSDKWLTHQHGKLTRGLASMEETPPHGPIDIGAIALACALGYLDLRMDGSWRAQHPQLVAWLDAFSAQVPAFETTRVKPA